MKLDVSVDFHEYTPFRKDYAKLGTFGIANIYDVMFLYSGNLVANGSNVPAWPTLIFFILNLSLIRFFIFFTTSKEVHVFHSII